MTRFLPWQVLHAVLPGPLPDLHHDAASGGLFVVFWHHDIPLGQLLVPAALLPISSAQLAATVPSIVAPAVGHRIMGSGFEPPLPVPAERQIHHAPPDLRALLAIERPLEMVSRSEKAAPPDAARASVSVVVCTRDRPDHLEKCLTALAALAGPPHEIIVVDNAPGSGSTRAVTSRFPNVRYVPEPRPGLSVARNCGVRECSGAIIAFTDDDVIVHPRWVEALSSAFLDPEVMATTGLVLPAELATPAQHVFQTDALGWGWGYRAVDFGADFFNATKHLGVPAWRLGAGANMAFRREVFERVGLFDERLGAGAAGCSEDSELWYRLLAEGLRCRYVPSAVVLHHHRADWEGLREQMHSYMRGHVTALFVQFDRYGHWGNVYRAFVALPWYLATLAFHSGKRRLGRVLYDSGVSALSQPVFPQISGALAGYGYYLRHRTRRSAGVLPPGVGASVHAR